MFLYHNFIVGSGNSCSGVVECVFVDAVSATTQFDAVGQGNVDVNLILSSFPMKQIDLRTLTDALFNQSVCLLGL